MKKMLLLLIAVLAFQGQALASHITAIFVGGTPPTNSTGSGNFTACMDAECRKMEMRVKDPDYSVTIYYGWGSDGTEETLLTQGGTPSRTRSAQIWFNNDNNPLHHQYYLPADPYRCLEATNWYETSADLGGGQVNVSRTYTYPCLAGDQHINILGPMDHEIGHVLGLNDDNDSFGSMALPGYITVAAPLPYAGTVIQFQRDTNNTVVPHIVNLSPGGTPMRTTMNGSFAAGELRDMSVVDMLLIQKVNGFTNVDLGLTPPTLKLTRATSCQTTLTWVSGAWLWRLQQTCDFKSWAYVTNAVAITNGAYTVTVQCTNACCHYRLARM